jgi:CheY-like chemotaxis protein
LDAELIRRADYTLLSMAQILLAGKDWQARALVRAQLLEEGLEVEACETVGEAVARLESRESLPDLFLADLSMSDDPASDVELLAAWAKQLPVWVIASRNLIVQKTLKGRGFEIILFRPVDVGELVDQIKHRVEG